MSVLDLEHNIDDLFVGSVLDFELYNDNLFAGSVHVGLSLTLVL